MDPHHDAIEEPWSLDVSSATASAEAVSLLLRQRYDLEPPPACVLLSRGINDSYAVRTARGERFVLRLSGHRPRGEADVASETAFLDYLDRAGVPVAPAMPTRDGALFTRTTMPDGLHAAVLFRHAEGRRPDLDAPEDARRQGVTLARLHDAADRYPEREAGRYRLDIDHLLHRPLRAILALDLDAPAALDGLRGLADRLSAAIDRVDGELSRTRCHGDCHGLNARIATEGPRRGEATFFDFDDGGFGYLAYDLAVHLWAQVSFGRRRHALSHAFDAGYRAVRAIGRADAEAMQIFVPIRHIWLMGEYAGRTAEWGTQVLPAEWLEREVAFMLAWEDERIAPALLRF